MTTSLEDLLIRRRSTRAFMPDPVPRAVIEQICRAARSAPSGANLQPGQFHVLTGKPLAKLVSDLQETAATEPVEECEYSYFPSPMSAPLKARQRAAGMALYHALGIERRDIASRRAQFNRNYAFFGAPVGIVVTIDRDMGKGCFMDLGMSLMAMFLAIEDRGLSATGIGALANYGRFVHRQLHLPANQMVVCGIALGHRDDTAAVNKVQTQRADLNEYTSFLGFED